MAFVNYEKAFDCVSLLTAMNALRNSNIDSGYIHLIGNIYEEATAKVKLPKTSDHLVSERVWVREGDTISPKMFNAILQEIFREKIGMKKV